ncbi:MAG: thymidine phosphorylase, partial [Calditrichia bacterium]|nr:thymidine phosphorylase [Calditrichia bacterium]
MLIPVDIIKKKRNKEILTDDEIKSFISGYLDGTVKDYQMASLLMAIYLNGMNFAETLTLTNTMLHSGRVLDLSHIPGSKVDKHSTGGVGDKTSLILAPVVAACGINVPMISGRGLGHTGGTLDKLESIPGFNVNLSIEQFEDAIKEHKIALIGQTGEIAPADKIIYSLRDVTGTVESIPLITASIMSKKLAEGIEGLVLDIKAGSGAFMKDVEMAQALGENLVKVGTMAGKKVIGIITNMENPLGNYVGNWLEVKESIDCLHGKGDPELLELSLVLSALMILAGGKADDYKTARKMADEVIANGKAFDKFVEVCKLHGGDVSFIKNPEKYPLASNIVDIKATEAGFVEKIDAYTIGYLGIILGAGRLTKEDPVDPQAGIVLNKKVGDSVKEGEILCTLHTNKNSSSEIENIAKKAFTINKQKPVSESQL